MNEETKPTIDMPPLPEEEAPQEASETAEQESATPTNQPEAFAQEQQPKPKKDEHENLVALRKAKEAAERERDEMRRYFEEMQRAQQKKVEQPQEEAEPELNPDDIPEWRHVQKHIQKLENKLSQYEKQTTATTTESRLKAQYPDFDLVVSQANVEKLRKEYPEIANTLSESKDLYSKAVSAYTMIKRLGILPNEKELLDKKKVEQNSVKPRPLASMSSQQGDSPLSRANAFAEGLTDELKEKLYKEMQEAAKYR